MSKNIVVTFAGREKRISVLKDYIHEMMNKKIIDEWHIWDFTKNESDRNFFKTFGSVRYMLGYAGYQYYKDINLNSSIRFPVKISADLYIAFVPEEGDQFIEALIGGWGNGQTRIRVLDKKLLSNYERSADDRSFAIIQNTPCVLAKGLDNNICIKRDVNGVTNVTVDDYQFQIPEEYTKCNKFSIYLRTNFNNTLELTGNNDKIKRFIGNVGEESPFFRAYQYYATEYNLYKNDLFIKCDEDVVYIELEKVRNFIKFTRNNSKYFLVSANVVNNGTCAYLQQKNGSIPEAVDHYEEPDKDKGRGSLWESGEKAEKLHDFFISKNAPSLTLSTKVVELDARNSINFVAWHGRQLRYMSFSHSVDDEYLLTVAIPQYLNKKTAIYSDLMVAHLTFDSQEKRMNVDQVIERYDQLKKKKYRI